MTNPPSAACTAAAPSRSRLAAFRAQLDEQRRFRIDQLAELRALDPGNTSEVTEVLAAGARTALQDVLDALSRMDHGTYGACTECGAAVPLERLEVLPQVRHCLACSRAAAARAGH